MLFVYPTPQYPRRPVEYIFKGLYLIASFVHLISMVTIVTDFYIRLGISIPDYFTKRELRVDPAITSVMQNCVYEGYLHLGNVAGTVRVDLGAITIGLMSTAQYIIALFVLEFILFINNGLCSLNYSTGNRHLRVFGVHVPFHQILVTFTYVYSIAIIVLCWCGNTTRLFYLRALRYCAAELQRTDRALYLQSEYQDLTIFTTPVYWPFAATCFDLVIYLAAAGVLCWLSHDRATTLLSEADAPWEKRGFFCATSKPLLKLHTAQRAAIIDDARRAIGAGEKVRIVRSYQLMTEEDFEALVQAMRDQVAQALKEKQFENLKENFGDRESQIDEGGLVWRQPFAAAQPPQPELPAIENPDQLYDVNFGDYFTDNEEQPSDYPPEVAPGPQPPVAAPLFPEENNDDWLNADDAALGGPYMPEEVDYDHYLNGAIEEPWSPQEEDDFLGYGAGADEAAAPPERSARHRRRRRSRHRHRDADEVGGDEDYEPEPRSPGGRDYYPPLSSSRRRPHDGQDSFIARDAAPPHRHRRHGGRQAEVEEDISPADAFSDKEMDVFY